jgi:hypothetical protein
VWGADLGRGTGVGLYTLGGPSSVGAEQIGVCD